MALSVWAKTSPSLAGGTMTLFMAWNSSSVCRMIYYYFNGIIFGHVTRSYQIAQMIFGLGVAVHAQDNFGVVLIDFILSGLPDGATVGFMGGIFVSLAITLLN
jgi:hypothetical protein